MNSPSADGRFQPGEIAILNTHGNASPAGAEVEIVEWILDCWEVVGVDGNNWHCAPSDLRKKRPPAREDHQLTTWEQCAWRPQQVNA